MNNTSPGLKKVMNNPDIKITDIEQLFANLWLLTYYKDGERWRHYIPVNLGAWDNEAAIMEIRELLWG